MLYRVAVSSMDESLRTRWVDAIGQEGLPAAAAVVKALRPAHGEFRELLHSALYGDHPVSSYFPQALAQQIAWFKRELGNQVRIATGNYDGLIEQALRDLGLSVHSYITWRKEPSDSAAVYHLHGRLIPAYPATGRLVLSEEDYALIQHPGAWQERFMRDALEETLCIFVGLSMTDPNLIRWLYRYSADDEPAEPRHVALFVRQATPDHDEALRERLEDSTRQRWARCGVETIWADFFGESAQFLHEVALLRSGRHIAPFHERARIRLEAATLYMAPRDEAAFRERQEWISAYLGRLLEAVRHMAAADSVDLSAEELGLGLWVANHSGGTLACWVTSDRRLNSMHALVENPFEYDSRWIAVEAVTRGVVVQEDPDVFASRWRLVRGIPIVVEDDDGAGRTIVGVMTLTSMTPHGESALSRAPRGLLGAIDDVLSRPVALLFES